MDVYLHIVCILIFCTFVTSDEYISENDLLSNNSYRLPTNLQPLRYKLQLEPLFEPLFVFNGKVKIQFRCKESTTKIVLHMKNITIDDDSLRLICEEKSSKLPRIKKYYEVEENNFLVIELNNALKEQTIYTLDIHFKGKLTDEMVGFYRSSYDSKTGNKKWLAASDFEPTDARRAFPCFDEPSMKAEFEITLIRPKDMISLSNMEISKTVPRDDGKVADHFKPTVRMSTYLLAFIVCDFEFKEAKTKKGVTVKVWARSDMIKNVDRALKVATHTIEFYEDYFEIDYPLNKMDLIAVPDFKSGAMENWGLITFRERLLLFSPETSTELSNENVILTINHELAHQWFGNLVTMEWWDDLWLNEGFATAMQYLSSNISEPTWREDDQLVPDLISDALYSDSFSNSHPISTHVKNPDEIGQLFDEISYSKGASLIRMMSFILGSETFRMALKNYLTKFSYKNAVDGDFWNCLSSAAESQSIHVNVKEMMNTWALQMGYPVITITRDYDQQTTEVTQKHFLQNMGAIAPTDKPYTWEVPVTYIIEGQDEWDPSQIIWLHKNNETLDLIAPSDKWVLSNVKVVGFFRANYDEKNWMMIINQLREDHTKIHADNRGQIFDDAFALARGGLLNYKIAFEATTYLHKETDYITWNMALSAIAYEYNKLKLICKDKYFRLHFLKKIASLYQSLGWNEDRKTETHINQLFRSIILSNACKYGLKDCIMNAKQRFKEWKENTKEIVLSANIRSTILCYGIKHGDRNDWEFVWKEYSNTTDSELQQELLGALSCSKDKKMLEKYLQLSLDSPDIRNQDMDIPCFKVGGSAKWYSLAWEFFKTNWKTIKIRAGSLKYSVSSTTTYFTTEKELKDLKDFYNANKEQLASVSKTIERRIEAIQGNIIWMRTKKDSILEWLDKNVKSIKE